MKTLMYWQAWPAWRRYLPAALSVLVVIAFWVLKLAGRTEPDLLALWFFIWVFVPDWVASPVITFAGGILLVQKGSGVWPIPLAEARADRQQGSWVIHWQERGRTRTRSIPSDVTTDALLTDALAQVKAEAAASQPLPSNGWTWPTVLHEGGPVYLHWLLVMAVTIFAGAAALKAGPLIALPWVALPYLVRPDMRGVRYALTAEGLWVVWPGREAALIPADQITEVTGTKRRVTIRTSNPWCPEVIMGTNGLAQVTLDWIERTKHAPQQ